ncbi:MAG: VIT1/CCC1 transporter family protein [Candidatus Ryanbacteria bacterium]|nr:VIT1/CCC1 transporter family protein [Candidatus Ryanbacteria bacterium]
MILGGRYLKDMIYGANDGIITTFAIAAGVAGAQLSSSTVILLGAANLFADGFSMAVSNYLGSKSERDFQTREYDREKGKVLSLPPEEEQAEMEKLLVEEGYSVYDAQVLGPLIFKNKRFFADIIMHEEFDEYAHLENNPLSHALATFGAFVAAGFIPITPFFFLGGFLESTIVTAGTLFLIGALRSLFTKRFWILSGLEMLFVGGIAASIAYGVGVFLKSFAF